MLKRLSLMGLLDSLELGSLLSKLRLLDRLVLVLDWTMHHMTL
jgi:hypothetical protein